MAPRQLIVVGALAAPLALVLPEAAAAPPPEAGNSNAGPAARAARVALTAVDHRDPPVPSSWRFEPGGRRIASVDESGACTLWDVPSGSWLGAFTGRGGADSPCESWPTAAVLREQLHEAERSGDGAFEARVVEGTQEVRVHATGDMELVDGIPLPDTGLDLAWAPGGRPELAVLASDPPRVEIWDIDGRTRLRKLAFAPKYSPTEGWLAWRADGLVAVTVHDVEIPCDDAGMDIDCPVGPSGEALPVPGRGVSSFYWPDPAAQPGAAPKQIEPAQRRVEGFEGVEGVERVTAIFDDQLRWLGLFEQVVQHHDSYDSRVWSLATGPGPDPQLGYFEPANSYDARNDVDFGPGQWFADAETAWIEAELETDWYDGPTQTLLSLRTLEVYPRPRLASSDTLAQITGEAPADSTVDLFFTGGTGLAQAELCVDGQCAASHAVPEGCEGVIGVARKQLLIARCDGEYALVEPGLRGPGPQVLRRLPFAADAQLRVGASGWVAVFDASRGELLVVDLHRGDELLRRDDVRKLMPVPLAGEQDRLAVIAVDDRFELLELDGGSPAVLLELDGAVELAALSPAGDRLAVRGGGRVTTYELATAASLASWPAPPFAYLAWRQDGAALLVGDDLPAQVLDPRDGSRLADIDTKIYAGAGADDIDESWRWVNLDTGHFLRTLDFRKLRFGFGWSRLDTGQFDGEPPTELLVTERFRLAAPFAEAPPLGHEALAGWLATPGLFVDFFSGQAIAPPTIPEVEAKRLLGALVAGGVDGRADELP